ncbi:MAG: ABC transporter substrate-binding protein [Acidimicrobiales bacterium]
MARQRLGVALLAVGLVAVACSSAKSGGSATTTTAAAAATDPLGPLNPATGTPVKIGMIDDGKGQGFDNSIDTPVAQATVKWLNERVNGFAGHPITLDICITNGDPSKATDCANQLITDNVVAVAVSESSQVESIWSVLQPAHMPVMFYGTGSTKVLSDTQTGFALGSPVAVLVAFPAGLAKAKGATTVTAVVIDVPAATDAYKGGVAALYQQQGLKLDVVPVAPGTADMTPQMQRVVSTNPTGIVTVVGNDSFCIAAFNGLRTAGFKGTVAAVPQCLTDATRKAVPADFLKGMQIGATTPFPEKSDPSVEQYFAVIDKYGAADVDHSSAGGIVAFTTIASLAIAVKDLKGDVTPATVAAAIKAMQQSVMPGTGGQHFRCNGKADSYGAAICSHSLLSATLDATGNPSGFTLVNDTPIPD